MLSVPFAQIPPHAQHDQVILEIASSEQRWAGLLHRFTHQSWRSPLRHILGVSSTSDMPARGAEHLEYVERLMEDQKAGVSNLAVRRHFTL